MTCAVEPRTSSNLTVSAALERIAALRENGSHRRAIQLATLELNRRPPADLEAAIRIERARCLMRERDWKRAERDCRHALLERVEPCVQALLGECLLAQKRNVEAVLALEAAVQGGDGTPDRFESYARALSEAGRHAEACVAAERAQRGNPAFSATYLHVLAAAGRLADVIAHAERELELRPAQAWLWTLLGSSLDALGQSNEAAVALRRAVELEPGRVDANCGLAMALLRLGRYESGFRHYEFRQRDAGRRRLGVPAWQGEPLGGKHLIVRAEQGLGDTVQFARFLRITRERGAHTTLIVPPVLVRLLRNNPLLGDVQGGHPPFGLGDYQTLVMSLPHHLGLGDSVDSVAVPYLFPEPELVQRWRSLLPAGSKVALAWQGNPSYAGDKWRSMPFAFFAPLLLRHAREIRFIALQKHTGRQELHASPLSKQVLDLGERVDALGDAFVDSAAVLSALDLLITTDNGLAHVAGALGVPTWLLLGTAPDWRWGLSGDRSRWYPKLRLFRQATAGDWRSLVETVSSALAVRSIQGE